MMAKELPLSQGRVAIVDDEDYEYLSQWKWCYNNGYASRGLTAAEKRESGRKSGKVLMHREIMGHPKGMMIDHINGNGVNNQRSNLRICSTEENAKNQRIQRNNTSGFKGVSWIKRDKKWRAVIYYNGKLRILGTFQIKEEAADAYDRAACELYRDYALPNFILAEREEGYSIAQRKMYSKFFM
jgi:hypothetical protein